MEYAIILKNIVKDFGSLRAVAGLNLKVPKGTIFGFIGPNGSGKTTTIKIAIGLLRPTSGEVFVLGKKVPDPAIYPRIGYMPQEIALYQDITVSQTIRFFGEVFGLDKESILKREKELLSFVELTEEKDTMVSGLSGGMKHRLSLAVSLVHSPEILFLDEPTVGIDPELRTSFWSYFGDLADKGVTVLITTHYMDEASRCDIVGMIRKGKLVAEGSPDDLKKKSGQETLEDAFLWFLGDSQ